MSRLRDAVVLVTPRSFGAGEPELRLELESAVAVVKYNQLGRAMTSAELRERIADADGLLAGLDDIDAEAIAASPKLRVISRYGVGTSNVDLVAAARHGVVVTNTPGANAESVAELTIAFFFALARSITRADRAARAGNWQPVKGDTVAGKTVGILGLGTIGKIVAEKALALGCRIVAYDPWPDEEFAALHDIKLAGFENSVRQADYLTLHLPLNEETRGLIDADVLQAMRPGSYLVNTSRGEIVEEEDLLDALDEGRLAGAALDTLAEEPPPPGHPLLQREDVIVTPHIGAHTRAATAAMGRAALDDLLAVLDGRPPRHPVVPAPTSVGSAMS